MSCLMSCEAFLCGAPATHHCQKDYGWFCEKHTNICCKPINSEPEGNNMTHEEEIAAIRRANEEEAQFMRRRVGELLGQLETATAHNTQLLERYQKLRAKADVDISVLEVLAATLFKTQAAKDAIRREIPNADIGLDELVENAMDEVDWREKVNDQLYSLGYIDESRAVEVVKEVLGSVDWAEVLSQTQISITID